MAKPKKKRKKKKKKKAILFDLRIRRDTKKLTPAFVLLLGSRGKVWITAFGKKIARLKGCKHKKGHPRPTKETSLNLSGLGDKLGLQMNEMKYTETTKDGRSGFLLPSTSVVTAGDWEATEEGGSGTHGKGKPRGR